MIIRLYRKNFQNYGVRFSTIHSSCEHGPFPEIKKSDDGIFRSDKPHQRSAPVHNNETLFPPVNVFEKWIFSKEIRQVKN